MASTRRRTRRSFGAVRKLPSGRYQASYLDDTGRRVTGPTTFTAKIDADAWLSRQRTALEDGSWRPVKNTTTVGAYCTDWVATLRVRERTKYNYERSINRWILPTFGSTPLQDVTTPMVRKWVGTFPADKPAARAQAYTVLHRIFRDAMDDGIIAANPVRVRGASEYSPARDGHALTIDQVLAIAAKMPDDEALTVTVGAFCGLRPGEVLALRRRDVDLDARVVRVRETASAVIGGSAAIGPTKTAGSVRAVHFPPTLDEQLRKHLAEQAAPGARGHLFPSARTPGRPMPYSTWASHFRGAVTAAGLEDVRPHDLRHTGATLAADTGATVSELMARLGHTSPAVAMRYQHAVRERDRSIADALGSAIAAQGRDDDPTTTSTPTSRS